MESSYLKEGKMGLQDLLSSQEWLVEEPEFNLDLPPSPPGKGGTQKMPAHATTAPKGDIPAVLSPSPEPSVPARLRCEWRERTILRRR